MKGVAVFFVAAIASVLATGLLHAYRVPASVSRDVGYADFLSITLTALSLMITVLAIFIAAAGVFGWATWESKLKDHSIEYFAKQLEKDGPLRRELEQLFADIAYRGIEGLKKPDPSEANEERPYAD